jgi:NADPH-dependent glutamate synthase beta subunit-like oxidoreductase
MRHVAVIGSGPAGYYTAEACTKQFGDGVRIDIIDRLPVPYGLIRSGVAPDHQSIKAVSRRYEATALGDTVRFVGNVTVGQDVSIDELRGLYGAVVIATGAPADRPLGIPGDDLPGVVGSAAFVGWYNGHPDFAGLAPPLDGPAVIVGAGNVALDVARILAKTKDEFDGSDIVGHALAHLGTGTHGRLTILARRGPHDIAMTPKELGELGHLARAQPKVDAADLPPAESDAGLEPGRRKSVAHLRSFAAAENAGKPITVEFDFFAMPVRIEGEGKVERVIVERTRIDESGRGVGTGETYTIPAGLVVSCIGYRTPPIPGLPYDEKLGRFANVDGRITDGVYAAGWARRGPTGTIGTNRPDGFLLAEHLAADLPDDGGKVGRAGLDALLAERGVDVVTFRDWLEIERAEVAGARTGSPREKFTSVAAMLGARRG